MNQKKYNYDRLTQILEDNDMSHFGIVCDSIYELTDEPGIFCARVSEYDDPFGCDDIYYDIKTGIIE